MLASFNFVLPLWPPSRGIFFTRGVCGGGGKIPDPIFVLPESFSKGQIRLHSNFHLPVTSGSALKVRRVGRWLGGCINQL